MKPFVDLKSPNFISSADGEQSRSTERANQHIHILRAGISTGKSLVPLIRHFVAGGQGRAAPEALGKGSVILQAELKFTFKPRSLGAAALSLLVSLSSETKADDALPSGSSRFSQSEAQLLGRADTAQRFQPPRESAPGDTAGKTTGEGMGTAPTTTELRVNPPRGFVPSPGRAAQLSPRPGAPAPPAAKGCSTASIPWESPVIT